ncbi:MAG TPA: 2-amino-4-hydroxy-6-hydroxymethyldihydropteridine diphosphokinase [Bryobacteraceae bacterium]
MKTVYLSLGSNVGDREAMLQAAIQALPAAGVTVARTSSLYETEPRDLPNQPWFLNLITECRTELFPAQLLGRLQKIERELGRKRTIAKGPRTIDIDIILYGNAIVRTTALEIPHPRFRERRFVLAPLKELVPDLRDPVTRRTVADLLAGTADQKVRLYRR